MPEFKVGDRVRLKRGKGHSEGARVGTVRALHPEKDADWDEDDRREYLPVMWDDGKEDMGWGKKLFVLVEPANPHEGADQYYMAVTGEAGEV